MYHRNTPFEDHGLGHDHELTHRNESAVGYTRLCAITRCHCEMPLYEDTELRESRLHLKTRDGGGRVEDA